LVPTGPGKEKARHQQHVVDRDESPFQVRGVKGEVTGPPKWEGKGVKKGFSKLAKRGFSDRSQAEKNLGQGRVDGAIVSWEGRKGKNVHGKGKTKGGSKREKRVYCGAVRLKTHKKKKSWEMAAEEEESGLREDKQTNRQKGGECPKIAKRGFRCPGKKIREKPFSCRSRERRGE